MSRLPFFLRRPWLIVKGTFTNRDSPDLDRLRRISDPEEFVWAVLPHAARSFATSIMVLPKKDAWAAAIAYLLCRCLDTYEDLHPDVSARPDVLRQFGSRIRSEESEPLPAIGDTLATTPRDLVHLLLIERMDLIDAAYRTLSPAERQSISQLVGNMAEGMAWAAETFAAQGGVLVDAAQRARYCHYVIGEPALYAMRSLLHVPSGDGDRDDALDVAVMVQLANITRDIEKDLERGVAYHQSLRQHLFTAQVDEAAATQIRRVRDELIREALPGIDGYSRLVDRLGSGLSQARGAAVLMLSFTDRYYSRCANRAGHPGWGERPRSVIYANAILSTLSAAWARRVVGRTERRFVRFLRTPSIQ